MWHIMKDNEIFYLLSFVINAPVSFLSFRRFIYIFVFICFSENFLRFDITFWKNVIRPYHKVLDSDVKHTQDDSRITVELLELRVCGRVRKEGRKKAKHVCRILGVFKQMK